PAGDPVIPVLIAACAITGKIDTFVGTEVGINQTLMIAVDGANLAGPGALDHQIAITDTMHFVAVIVEQRRFDAEERAGGRTWLEVGGAGKRGDHDRAGLGLPPGIDDRAAAIADDMVVPLP